MIRRRNRGPSSREVEGSRVLAAALERWYARHGRDFSWRHWSDEYRVAVVELLLQRTRAETVEAFAGAFFAKYPGWSVLSRVRTSTLERHLSPIGLQFRRASSLKALARHVTRGGGLRAVEAPGVGQYIERAVKVSTASERLAMVDSNWVRVFSRLYGGKWMADYRYDARLQGLAQEVVNAARCPRSLNWAVLDLGATVCTPRNPSCDRCPLATDCHFARRLGVGHAKSNAARSIAPVGD